jgi:hypothetical protein
MNQNFFNNNLLNRNNQQNLNQLHMMQMYQNMMKMKQDYSNKKIDDKMIYNAIIQPNKIERGDQELNKRYKVAEVNYKPEIDEWRKKRTNMPYKGVLKNENYNKDFKKQEDLIVHKVTQLDKLGLNEDFNKFVTGIEKHNGELKVIYSANNKNENYKKFEYNQKFKYNVQFNPKDFDELKQDKIKYLEEQQKELVKDKENTDEIINILHMNGIIDDNELKLVETQTEEIHEKEDTGASNKKGIKKVVSKKIEENNNIDNVSVSDDLLSKYKNRAKK